MLVPTAPGAMAPRTTETDATADRVDDDAITVDAIAARLRAPLLRYLRRFAGDDALAEDLLQETLVRISKGLDTFEARSSVKTWAFKIATHTAIDHVRRTRRDPVLVEIDDDSTVAELGNSSGAGQRLVIDEMNTCLREEIDRLPGDYRAAILLHDLEGLTAAETAEIVGCTLATAKVRIHRARARLRKALLSDCSFYRDRDQVLRCDRKGPDDE